MRWPGAVIYGAALTYPERITQEMMMKKIMFALA
jgi:hypothetical protein